ncbi:MAG: hypothetical protein V9F46_00235 [Chitinophagaceae bacterium]
MRINISKVAPQAYDAILGLEKYLSGSGLDKKLFRNLLKSELLK